MANFTDFQSVFDLSSDAETDFDCTIGMEEDDMLIAAVEGFQEATIPDVNMKDFEDLHDTDDIKATVKDMESELGPGHDSKGSFAPTIDSTKTQEIIGDDVMDVLDLACPQFGVADAVQKGEGPDPEHINKEIDSKSDPMENSYEKHENSDSPKTESATDYDSALDELLKEADEDIKGDPGSSEDAAENKANNSAAGCGVKKEEVADVDSLEDTDDYSGYDDEDFEESSDIDDAVDVDSLEVDTDSAIEDEREEEVHKDFGDPSVDPTHGKEIEGDEGPVIDATKESGSIFDLLDECDFPGCKSEDKNPVSSEMDDDVHKDFGEPSVDPTHKKEIEGDEGPVFDEAFEQILESKDIKFTKADPKRKKLVKTVGKALKNLFTSNGYPKCKVGGFFVGGECQKFLNGKGDTYLYAINYTVSKTGVSNFYNGNSSINNQINHEFEDHTGELIKWIKDNTNEIKSTIKEEAGVDVSKIKVEEGKMGVINLAITFNFSKINEESVESLEEEVEGDIGLRDLDMGVDSLEMGDDPDDNDQEQLQDEEDIDDVGLDEAFMEIMKEADEILKDDKEEPEDEEKGAGGCKKESSDIDILGEESTDVDSLEDTPADEAIDDETISSADDTGDMSDSELSSIEDVEDDDILDDILGQ